MPDVVAVGDANVDIIAHFPAYPNKGEDALARSTEIHCGGSAANTAIALARMGINVSLISRVGPDSWALKVLSCLNEAGVDPQGLQRDPVTMTGLMYVIVTPDGERTIFGDRGANVRTDPSQIRAEEIHQARVLHLSGYALLAEPQRSAALQAFETARQNGLSVTLDPGMSLPHVALQDLQALLPAVHILLPSLTEAQQLTGQREPQACAQALLAAGVQVVALKLGQDGCLVYSASGPLRVPGFAVDTLDSTGAGDAFAAGFIAGFLDGLDWHSVAVLGNALGAMAAAQVGAGTGVTQAREVLASLGNYFDESNQSQSQEAIRRVSQFIEKLATASSEEERPWWT
jgi:ribokinase